MTKEQIKKYNELSEELKELQKFSANWESSNMSIYNGGRGPYAHGIELTKDQGIKIQKLVAERIAEIEKEIEEL